MAAIRGYAVSEGPLTGAEIDEEVPRTRLPTQPGDLVAEKYRGIRPAFGYPACPDHTEKGKLFALLDATAQGIQLTEHFAMTPPASVSGLYFANPQARYFMVGRIGADQVASYAKRKQQPVEEVERWLTSSLSYEPQPAGARC